MPALATSSAASFGWLRERAPALGNGMDGKIRGSGLQGNKPERQMTLT
jgi:hypothetical protein